MKKVLIGVVVVVLFLSGGLVVAGLVIPTAYAIERSVEIQATPEQVHVFVGDLEKWTAWSPWEESDPTIVTTLGEKSVGVGASQSWTSADGDGELSFTKSDAKTGIAYDMAFIMGETRAPAVCAMTYTHDAGTTVVTWTMEGDVSDFMPPVMAGLITPMMTSTIEEMFDKGLENLKEQVESGS